MHPTTDAGAIVQAVGVVVVVGCAAWVARREWSLVMLALGVACVVFGLLATRVV